MIQAIRAWLNGNNKKEVVGVELSTENFTVAVDSKKFVADPMAKVTLNGAIAMMNFALLTGEHHKLHVELVRMLSRLMNEFESINPNWDKPKGWDNNKKKGW